MLEEIYENNVGLYEIDFQGISLECNTICSKILQHSLVKQSGPWRYYSSLEGPPINRLVSRKIIGFTTTLRHLPVPIFFASSYRIIYFPLKYLPDSNVNLKYLEKKTFTVLEIRKTNQIDILLL